MLNVKLKTAMLGAGVSGLSLAQTIGIGPTRLSYIINGWVQPSAEEILHIENALNHRGLFDESDTTVQTIKSTKHQELKEISNGKHT